MERITIEEADKLNPNWRELTNWRPRNHLLEPIEFYKSIKTGKLYEFGGYKDPSYKGKYVNHGYGEGVLWNGRKDLPHNERPYIWVRRKQYIPLWLTKLLIKTNEKP